MLLLIDQHQHQHHDQLKASINQSYTAYYSNDDPIDLHQPTCPMDGTLEKDDFDIYLKNSIFVANLSQRLNNADLAWSLYHLFRAFGPIRSIKASRDLMGRPFGFIEFYSEEACAMALERNMSLELAGRPLRMERARRQLKLLIKYNQTLANTTDGLTNTTDGPRKLLESVLKNHRVSILQEPAVGISAIVRLDNPATAKELYQRCSKIFTPEQGWKVSWIGGDKTSISSIRSSGLVHLVFPPEVEGTEALDYYSSPPLSASPLLPYMSSYSPPTSIYSPEPTYNNNSSQGIQKVLYIC